MVTRGRDVCFLIIFLHLGFELDTRDILNLEPALYVEITAELCILFQPVFVVGLQPVYTPVFVDKEGCSTVHAVIVFQTVYLVVFIQAVF